jgi:allantoicase
VTHVRLNIFPDGGVSRVRVFGRVSQKGRVKAGLRHLNVLLREDAEAELLNCCGSRNWARRLAQQRPFEDVHRLLETAERIWGELSREDWLEAFTQHPKIGEKQAALSQAAEARRWSEQEQSGTHGASQETLAALAEANRAYEAKFGYIFIIWATGKNIEEVLGALNRRLENTPETELRIVGEEQRRITRLRLGKLLEQ